MIAASEKDFMTSALDLSPEGARVGAASLLRTLVPELVALTLDARRRGCTSAYSGRLHARMPPLRVAQPGSPGGRQARAYAVRRGR